jgi:hypothetical protein
VIIQGRYEFWRGFRRGFGWFLGVVCSVVCLSAAVMITYHAVVLAAAGWEELAAARRALTGASTRGGDSAAREGASSGSAQALFPAAQESPGTGGAGSREGAVNSFDCGLHVVSARFYYYEDQGGARKPVMDILVRNDTRQTVSKMHFCAKISSRDRKEPWAEDIFGQTIEEGLGPGKEIQMQFFPENDGPWAAAPGDDAGGELTIVPISIEDSAGNGISP